MAKISVTRPHNLGADAAKAALAPFEDDIAKYGLKPKWSGHKAELKGLGASGKINVEASSVTVEIKLGMLAASAGIKADKVEASISKRLEKALSADSKD